VVQNPLPENEILVAVELIKTAGADRELPVLFETLQALGPFKFPLEVVAKQTCSVLNIPLSSNSLHSMQGTLRPSHPYVANYFLSKNWGHFPKTSLPAVGIQDPGARLGHLDFSFTEYLITDEQFLHLAISSAPPPFLGPTLRLRLTQIKEEQRPAAN